VEIFVADLDKEEKHKFDLLEEEYLLEVFENVVIRFLVIEDVNFNYKHLENLMFIFMKLD
jgi:hypothetical protein